MDRLLDALAGVPEGATKNELKGKANLPTERLHAAVDAALASRMVVPCKVKAANRQAYPGLMLASLAV